MASMNSFVTEYQVMNTMNSRVSTKQNAEKRKRMIEDKEAYYKHLVELDKKKDHLIEEIASIDVVESLMSTYGTNSLAELKVLLGAEYSVTVAEYDEFTRERNETFRKISSEFGARQIQNFIANGYDTIDLINLYLSGKLKKE